MSYIERLLAMDPSVEKLEAIIAHRERAAQQNPTCPACKETQQLQLCNHFDRVGPRWKCRKCNESFHTPLIEEVGLGVAPAEPVAVLSAVSPSKTTEDVTAITNAGLFSGATLTAEGECITQRGERYVRVYQPASIPTVHLKLPGECYVRIYDASAALSELFTNAIGVAGPFKVVTMEGVKRNDGPTSLYKADGPGLIDEGWDHDPQVAIHRCRDYNNVWNAAKLNL